MNRCQGFLAMPDQLACPPATQPPLRLRIRLWMKPGPAPLCSTVAVVPGPGRGNGGPSDRRRCATVDVVDACNPGCIHRRWKLAQVWTTAAVLEMRLSDCATAFFAGTIDRNRTGPGTRSFNFCSKRSSAPPLTSCWLKRLRQLVRSGDKDGRHAYYTSRK